MRLALLFAVGGAVGVACGADPAPTPAGLLKDIEGPILKCKTFRTDITVTIGPGDLGRLKGKLVVAPGNRVRLDLAGTMKGEKGSMTMASDGKRMRMTGFGASAQDQPVEPQMSAVAKAAVARSGLFAALFLGARSGSEGEKREPFNLEKDLAVTGVKFGKATGRELLVAVEYTLNTPGSKMSLAVATWADAKTKLPTKRTVSAAEGGKDFTVTETYANTVLDGKVDDAEFVLPK